MRLSVSKSMGVDKSAVALSLFDMHLTPFAFCRSEAMGKNTELVGGHPTMLIQTATNTTSPGIVASNVSLKGYTWDNGNGSEKPVKVMIELCLERDYIAMSNN